MSDSTPQTQDVGLSTLYCINRLYEMKEIGFQEWKRELHMWAQTILERQQRLSGKEAGSDPTSYLGHKAA